MTDPAGDPVEALYARGVTDGLPVIPRTRARVAAAVAASGRDAGDLIALVPPNFGRATVEKIAVNVRKTSRSMGSAKTLDAAMPATNAAST